MDEELVVVVAVVEVEVEEEEEVEALPSMEVLKLVGGVGEEADLKRPTEEADDLRLEEALLLAELVLKRRMIL